MIETPKIIETTVRQAAVIHINTPRAEMQKVFGPAVQELMSTLSAQDIVPAGPLFAHHSWITPETFDFDLGVPVDKPVAPAGRVKPGELPAATVARTVYHGGYDGLGPAWGEFDAWIQENGHTPAANLWECYVVGPSANEDPAAWRTELNRPLKT